MTTEGDAVQPATDNTDAPAINRGSNTPPIEGGISNGESTGGKLTKKPRQRKGFLLVTLNKETGQRVLVEPQPDPAISTQKGLRRWMANNLPSLEGEVYRKIGPVSYHMAVKSTPVFK